ncbi:MAG: hypothetical protein L6Q37_11465 [Bdellovibrionaceae bacterium]|nr:hypothetical protein [Pseudobdellovibrionaceae bacterium]NUM58862.1 hypothetical protein [Pseudobdellovibrionaceae bacterium]
MMKILSLIVFVILLAWSWQVVHSTAPLDFETHSDIQAKMVELIENTIKSKKPDTKDIEIIKIWTRNSGDQKIIAQFNYKFSETSQGETVTRIIEGEAVLARDYSDNPTVDKWVIQSLQTKGDNISFTEGSLITPDNQEADENPSTTQAQVPPAEPLKAVEANKITTPAQVKPEEPAKK